MNLANFLLKVEKKSLRSKPLCCGWLKCHLEYDFWDMHTLNLMDSCYCLQRYESNMGKKTMTQSLFCCKTQSKSKNMDTTYKVYRPNQEGFFYIKNTAFLHSSKEWKSSNIHLSFSFSLVTLNMISPRRKSLRNNVTNMWFYFMMSFEKSKA